MAREVALPPESDLRPSYAKADLADANAVAMPTNVVRPVDEMARLALESPAPWYLALRRVRDAIVGHLGLPTTSELAAWARRDGGDAIGVFRVCGRSDREIILGAEDDHLHVRMSVLERRHAGGCRTDLIITTVVRCRDALGRMYLLAIRPVHGTAVRSHLRRAARALEAATPGLPPPDRRGLER